MLKKHRIVFVVILLVLLSRIEIFAQPICEVQIFDSAQVLTGPEELQLATISKILTTRGHDVRIITLTKFPEKINLQDYIFQTLGKNCEWVDKQNLTVLLYSPNTNSTESIRILTNVSKLAEKRSQDKILTEWQSGLPTGLAPAFENALREIENISPLTNELFRKKEITTAVVKQKETTHSDFHLPDQVGYSILITLFILALFGSYSFIKNFYPERRKRLERYKQLIARINDTRKKFLNMENSYDTTFALLSEIKKEKIETISSEYLFHLNQTKQYFNEADILHKKSLNSLILIPGEKKLRDIEKSYELAIVSLEKTFEIQRGADEELTHLIKNIEN